MHTHILRTFEFLEKLIAAIHLDRDRLRPLFVGTTNDGIYPCEAPPIWEESAQTSVLRPTCGTPFSTSPRLGSSTWLRLVSRWAVLGPMQLENRLEGGCDAVLIVIMKA
jgi:hypothetical protein